MIEKLKALKEKFIELTAKIGDPELLKDQETWQKLCKEHADLAPIVEKYEEYLKAQKDMTEAEELSKVETDQEMIALYDDIWQTSKKRLAEIEQELKILLLPKDENDDKNVIIELRAGAGGDEAALFAAELKRMYGLFADKHRFTIEELDGNYIEGGGVKECSFMVKGKGAFAKFKFESGVHRVQRVPVTESGGRIHTSTATVAIMPEAEEVDVELDMNDCKFDVFRASGNGGQ